MAQRIVLELKDKIAKEQGGVLSAANLSAEVAPPAESEVAEALSALTVLGYTKLPAELSATELIKETLKAIGKRC